MKLIKSLSVILSLAALLFMGCKGGSPKDDIVKKWKLTEVSGGDAAKMSDAEKKEMVDKLSLEFTKDGKCTMAGEGDTPRTGTYTISDDGKTLMMKQDGHETADQMNVSELSSGKLVMTEAKGGTTMSFKAN